MKRRPYKNALCGAHLRRPGFRHGDPHCACRRMDGHQGPHRCKGRWEWTERDGTQVVRDLYTGESIEL